MHLTLSFDLWIYFKHCLYFSCADLDLPRKCEYIYCCGLSILLAEMEKTGFCTKN